MGLIVSIYRDNYDSTSNVFHGRSRIVVVNADGPFEPSDDMPAAMIASNALGNPIIRPADMNARPVFGGTYGCTSDSRFREAQAAVTGQAIYGALPIHDRIER